MLYTVKNDKFSISVDTFGGQWASFKTADGNELLWQGNPEFWSGQAPILFPIVGKIRKDRIVIDGRIYDIPKHGLIRKSEWTLSEQGEDFIEMEINSNEDTLKAYPFSYNVKARYTLTENGVKNTFIVTNTGDGKMPFCIGGHPAFNLPFEEGYVLEDYVIEFGTEETLKSPVNYDEGLLNPNVTKNEITNCKTLPITNELFATDAIIYDNFKKKEISIKNPKTGKAITMDFSELEILALWKPYDASPFLCLEPWLGCGTIDTEDDRIESKKCVRYAKAGESFDCSFTVSFN